MTIQRLFHVLVIMGGASTGASIAGGCDSDRDREQRRDQLPDAAPAPDGSAELAACFCDVQACCDREADPAEVVPGFECCWSTTCP